MDCSLPHIPHFAFRIDQKDLPVNIKSLLDDDFLVEFFSARSRPRAPIRCRSSRRSPKARRRILILPS
jgi:hypothetical protein